MNINFSSLMVSGLIVMVSFIALLNFMGSVATNYSDTSFDAPAVTDFSNNIANFSGVIGEVNATKGNPTVIDSAVMVVTAGWTGIVTMASMPFVLIGAANDAMTQIPFIPDWSFALVFGIITLIFMLWVMKLIFKVI